MDDLWVACPQAWLQARQRRPLRLGRPALSRMRSTPSAGTIWTMCPFESRTTTRSGTGRRAATSRAAHGTRTTSVTGHSRPGPAPTVAASRVRGATARPHLEGDRQAVRGQADPSVGDRSAETRCITPPDRSSGPAAGVAEERLGVAVGVHRAGPEQVVGLGAGGDDRAVQGVRDRLAERGVDARPGAAGTARRTRGRGADEWSSPYHQHQSLPSAARSASRPSRGPRPARLARGRRVRRASPSSSQARRSSRWPIQMPKSALIHDPAKDRRQRARRALGGRPPS